jgi:hypothetical protein
MIIPKAPVLPRSGEYTAKEVRDHYHAYYMREFAKWLNTNVEKATPFNFLAVSKVALEDLLKETGGVK